MGRYMDKMMRSDGYPIPVCAVVRCECGGEVQFIVLRQSDTFEQAEHESVLKWGAGTLRREDDDGFVFTRNGGHGTD